MMPSMNLLTKHWKLNDTFGKTFEIVLWILGSLFGGLGRTGRNNQNNKDLNRDFPKQFDENQRVPFDQLVKGRQPETR